MCKSEVNSKWKKVSAVSVEVTMENLINDGGGFDSLEEFQAFFGAATEQAGLAHPEWFNGEGA